MSATCSFDTQHYRDIIGTFADLGYVFRTFRDYRPEEDNQVILRHDIDINIEDAVRIGAIDASLGVSASYHFLLTSETYNLCSGDGQRALHRLRALGHKIGLHIDPSCLPHEPAAAKEALAGLFPLAMRILGELDAYSLHRPATYGELDGLDGTDLGAALPPSADALRQTMIYRSDSRRVWRQGCVCREVASFSGASVQLLMHPVWWTDGGLGRDETLELQLSAHARRMDRYLAGNLSFYSPRYLPVEPETNP